jgi:hypothetical protein
MDPAQAALAAANAAWQAIYYASLAAQQQPGGAFALQPPCMPGLPPMLPPLAAFNPALLAGGMGQFVQWTHSVGPQFVPAVSTSIAAMSSGATTGAATGAAAGVGTETPSPTSRRLVASIPGVSEGQAADRQTPGSSSNSNSSQFSPSGAQAANTATSESHVSVFEAAQAPMQQQLLLSPAPAAPGLNR